MEGETGIQDVVEPPFVIDMTVHRIPRSYPNTNDRNPWVCLVAITSAGDLLVYKSFWHETGGAGGGSDVASGLRFARQRHDAMLRGGEIWDDMFVDEMELGDPTRLESLQNVRHSRLMHLDGAGGLEGVIVAGRNPHCIIFARADFRVHPVKLDRAEGIRSCARFQNPQCTDGVVFIADKGRDRPRGMLKICELPSDIVPDSAWPVRVKHIGVNVHNVVYHAATGCHLAVVSWFKPIDEAERKPEGAYEGKVPELTEEVFQLRLLAPYTFETIDQYEFDYKEGEAILALTVCHLKNTRQEDLLLPYVCVGTGFVHGECENSRATGRIYVFEISTIVGEAGYEGKSSYKIKQLFASSLDQDIKAPVTAVCQLEGYLLVCQGPNPGKLPCVSLPRTAPSFSGFLRTV